jgi:hypothetical protein
MKTLADAWSWYEATERNLARLTWNKPAEDAPLLGGALGLGRQTRSIVNPRLLELAVRVKINRDLMTGEQVTVVVPEIQRAIRAEIDFHEFHAVYELVGADRSLLAPGSVEQIEQLGGSASSGVFLVRTYPG